MGLDRLQRLVATVTLPIASLLAVALLGELAVRGWRWVRDTPPPFIVLDRDLGWRARENYDRGGIRTDSRGARTWDLESAGPGRPTPVTRSVLFLGDSYTHAVQVENTETFHHRVAGLLPRGWRVFAYGANGYSTLQERMVLERFRDEIEFDLVVWQLSPNDLPNNHPELERRVPEVNNGLRRPYRLPDGTVVRVLPRGFPAARHFANRHSRFLHELFRRWDRLSSTRESEEPSGKLLAEAESTTRALFEESLGAGGKVCAFLSRDWEPYGTALRKAAQEAGLCWIDGVAEAVAEAESRGADVRAADGAHWNARGHELVAAHLAARLADL